MGKWLQKLCVIHDGVRHLIVEIFLYHSKHPQVLQHLHVNLWNIGVLRYQQTSELIVIEVISSILMVESTPTTLCRDYALYALTHVF